MSELVQVSVGRDRFKAQLVAAACEDAGLRVQLLTYDENGVSPGMGFGLEYRLLVEAGDMIAVQKIVQRSNPDDGT